jgi:hypothetical protein
MSEEIKKRVYSTISGSRNWVPSTKAKIKIGQNIVHVRFCSTNLGSPSKYKFNLNPNTLSADFELWICGDQETYYLIPIEIINDIYADPNTYQDYHHAGIKVVSVDTDSNRVAYARGGKSLNLRPYLKSTL